MLHDTDVDLDAAIDSIAKPLVKVFLGRRWEVATLSRWHGVTHCMKRLALGVLFNNVIPYSLFGLSRQLSLSEEKLARARRELADAIARGEDAENKWLENASRVMKVSKFFQDPARNWQLGILLIVNSEIEHVHWALLGRVGKLRKASLLDLVAPRTSVLGRAMHRL